MTRIFLSFLVVSFLIGNLLPTGAKAELDYYSGLGGDFSLINQDNVRMNLKDYRGKVVLLTFGYTHCPDVCSINLSRLKQVVKKLGKQGDQVQILFISFDPERDTPEHLKNYVAYFDPRFVGLTGSVEELIKVTQQYGSAFFKQEVNSAAGYLFAHTDYIFLVDQEGHLRAFYKTDAPLDQMKDDIQSLLH